MCVADWKDPEVAHRTKEGKASFRTWGVGLGCSIHLGSSRNQSPQIETGRTGTLCCNASGPTWTQLKQRNTKQLHETKNTCMLGQLRQFWTKDTNRPKTYCHLKSQEQNQGAGSKSRILNMPPALNTTKEESKTPKPSLPSCHRRSQFTTP